MVKDPRIPLTDMRAAIAGIRDAVHGIDFEGFRSSRLIRRAVEREIEIVSEASRRVPEAMKLAEPGVPWREIAGIGNVFRHEYQNVSERVVWNVVEVHLDGVEAAVSRLLDER